MGEGVKSFHRRGAENAEKKELNREDAKARRSKEFEGMTKVIGRLERVPLREVWEHEERDFSRWLQDNVDVLNEALGLELQNIRREQPAGSFSIDLTAEDVDGNAVVIENQLEKSDHKHLGQLITYLGMSESKIAIWIVSEAREEHVSAVTWLNESTSASFYLVKVEAVCIENSPPAPLLTRIVGPSEEAREVSHAKRERTERHDLMYAWWNTLLEKASKITKIHANCSPKSKQYMSASVNGNQFVYTVNEYGTSVEIYMNREKESNEKMYDYLLQKRSEIEKSFGSSLEWDRMSDKKASKIQYVLSSDGGYRSPKEEWAEVQDRLIDAMVRLEKALRPYLDEINNEDRSSRRVAA